jgi:hypothetical protein
VFSNPTAVTNAYLPYAQFKQDVLVGTEGGKPARVVRTRMPGTKRFMVRGKPVEAIIVADSGWLGGELEEVALDYYAQSDQGDVYYFGEDVDNYEHGKVSGPSIRSGICSWSTITTCSAIPPTASTSTPTNCW